MLTHEVCHLVGMHHCTFFACLMNESSNVSQAQNQPLFLCPVCLRKLHKFLQFDIVSRYERLKDFMEQHCTNFEKQLSVSCNKQTDSSDYNDPSKHMDGVAVVERPQDEACDTSTFQKFRICSNWLERVLIFIG